MDKFPRLFVDFNVNSYQIHEGDDGDDPWRYRGAVGANVEVCTISLDPGRASYYGDNSFEPAFEAIVGDIVYLVHCNYTTGCTFGSSGGHTAIAGVFKDKQSAYNAKTMIEAHYQYFHGDRFSAYREKASKPNPYKFTDSYELTLLDDNKNPYIVHVSWYDYFGGLDSVDLTELIVEDNKYKR